MRAKWVLCHVSKCAIVSTQLQSDKVALESLLKKYSKVLSGDRARTLLPSNRIGAAAGGEGQSGYATSSSFLKSGAKIVTYCRIKTFVLTEVEWKLTSPLSDQQSFVTKLSQSVTSQNPVATTLKPIIRKRGILK